MVIISLLITYKKEIEYVIIKTLFIRKHSEIQINK